MLQVVAELTGKPYRWPDRTCMALTERMAELTGAPVPGGYAEYKSLRTEARATSMAIAAHGSLAAAHEAVLSAGTAEPVEDRTILRGDIAILEGAPSEQIMGLVGTDFMVWTMAEIGPAATHTPNQAISFFRINVHAD